MTRLGYAFATTAAVSLLGITSIASFAPKLVWNASASTPIESTVPWKLLPPTASTLIIAAMPV